MPALESLGKVKYRTSLLILGCSNNKKGAQKRLDHTCSVPSNTNYFLALRKLSLLFFFPTEWAFSPFFGNMRRKVEDSPSHVTVFNFPNRLEYVLFSWEKWSAAFQEDLLPFLGVCPKPPVQLLFLHTDSQEHWWNIQNWYPKSSRITRQQVC